MKTAVVLIAGMLASGLIIPGARAAADPTVESQPPDVSQVAPKPPMGWNSWNHFAGRVTDADIRSAADFLVSTGMRAAGYVYVNIDDMWQGKRDAHGVLHSNERFPDMKALSDYIHAQGLKFGIYSSPGARTCAGYEGSLGHEAEDARMYAAWGVDFLKYDLCSLREDMKKASAEHADDPDVAKNLMLAAYRKMGDALRATGRTIVYSLCQYGVDQPWTWGPSVGASMWRTTGDISDSYARMTTIGFSQAGLAGFAGAGHWNDPDMLEIGNGKMSEDEYRTHMSLWALLAAPLLAGNDLSKMGEADRRILTNKDAIAIDQDALGKQGDRLYQDGDLDVWTRPLSGGRVAVGLFNRGASPRDIPIELAKVGFPAGVRLWDVWKGKDLGLHSGTFTDTVPNHGVTLLIAGSGVLAYAAGDIAQCKSTPQKSAAAQTAKMIPPDAVVFVVGDTTYPTADRATLESCYTPTWGQFLPRTYAVPGNHDYVGGSPNDFLDYFGARTPHRTWFRAQVGDWWVIGLDSNVSGAVLDEQQAWLEEQLKAIEGDGRCVLAMWHHPVFSTGLHRKDGARMRPAWAALERAGADLVLNGHEHFYESFEPKDASGLTVSTGLREIIAGTGGAHLHDLSVVRGAKTYARVHGLLELHLEKDHYQYAFRTLRGRVRDSGGAQCRRTEVKEP